MVAEVRLTAALKSRLYFSATMRGTIKLPMAAAAATADPEMAPNNMQAMMVT
ncbi:hypothetical protein ES703_24713 [subsurface metagenome]